MNDYIVTHTFESKVITSRHICLGSIADSKREKCWMLNDFFPSHILFARTLNNSRTKKLDSIRAVGWHYKKLGYKEMPKFLLGTDAFRTGQKGAEALIREAAAGQDAFGMKTEKYHLYQ